MDSVDGDTALWPSPPLLYQVTQQFSLNASLPHMFLPSPDLSSVLYWYVTSFTGHWPLARNPGRYTFSGFCGHPKTNPIARVYQGRHILCKGVSRASYIGL